MANEQPRTANMNDAPNPTEELELDKMLYSADANIESIEDLLNQRGTSIPALFNTVYKFIQNPSSVSVETFKRMIDTDDTIGSGVDFLTTCLAARLGPYTHTNKDVAKWVNSRLKEIKGGWFNTVKEIMSAAWAGYSVSEKVWKNDPKHGFVPHKIVTIPPNTVMFETERTGELTPDGILQYQRNWSPMGLSQGVGFFGGLVGTGNLGWSSNNFDSRPDPYARFGDLPFPVRVSNTWQYLSIRIPVQKCIHYSFDAQGKFGNPYGRSLLRRAYKWYVLKDSVLQMLAVALDRKGTPLLIVYADNNTTVQDSSKVAGKTTNQRGQRVGARADQAASSAFSRVHNDSTIVLPGKKGTIYEVDSMTQQSNANDFIEAIRLCNQSIMRALLIPSLIFTNGDGTGSYALGQEHSRTFLRILDGILDGLIGTLIENLVVEMLVYNFPREMWEKDGFGTFTMRDFNEDNGEKLSMIWERAINSGVIDPEDMADLNRMRDVLGFPERETPIENKFTESEAASDMFGGIDDAQQDDTGNQ